MLLLTHAAQLNICTYNYRYAHMYMYGMDDRDTVHVYTDTY